MGNIREYEWNVNCRMMMDVSMYHDDPILKKTSIYRGCSIAMFDYRTANVLDFHLHRAHFGLLKT